MIGLADMTHADIHHHKPSINRPGLSIPFNPHSFLNTQVKTSMLDFFSLVWVYQPLVTLALVLAVLAGTIIGCTILPIVKQRLTSPLRFLPGPEGSHWFYGHAKAIQQADPSTLQEMWMDQYGPTIAYRDILGVHINDSSITYVASNRN